MKATLATFVLLTPGLGLAVSVSPAYALEEAEEADRPEIPVIGPYTGPTTAAPKSAPAIVVLPPRFEIESSPKALVAAEAASDRLAQEIAARGKVQVVNRTELSRILEERKTAGRLNRPLTGYSAMIRLEIGTAGVKPRTLLKVVDLSTGNVLGEKEFGWPLAEADIAPMTTLCRSAIKDSGRLAAGKTRVRLLGASDTGQQVRMKPLAMRLETAYARALARSKDVLLVEHLEAASSQEESLLLLMGLSRLPGGKRFTPQADATIELRVREGDGLGKTFAETPVTIAVRLGDSDEPRNAWLTTAGTVKQFDGLIERSWRSLSRKLTDVEPGSASDSLDEMRVRRTQAEAELRAARDAFEKVGGHKASDHIQQAIARADAALKIDPTYPEPLLFKARMLHELALYYFMYHHQGPLEYDENGEIAGAHIRLRNRAGGQAILACERYVTHAGSDRDKHADAYRRMLYVQRFTPLGRIYKLHAVQMTPYIERLLRALRVGFENSLNSSAGTNAAVGLEQGAITVYRGMKLAGTTKKQRRSFMKAFVKRYDRWMSDYRKGREPARSQTAAAYQEQRYYSFKVLAATMVGEDGLPKAASARLRALTKGARNPGEKVRRYKAELRRLHEARKELPSRAAPADTKTATLLAVKWPRPNVWQTGGGTSPNGQATSPESGRRPDVPSTTIARLRPDLGIARYQGVSPIAVADERAYLILARRDQSLGWDYDGGGLMRSDGWRLAYVPLDQDGRPLGKSVSAPIRNGREEAPVWEPIRVPRQPEGLSATGSLFARAHGGKLYLGTPRSGLFIFDPEQESWKAYGPDEGLPAKSVHSFFFLDENRLYIASNRFAAKAKHFTLNLQNGEVKLLHAADAAKNEYYSARLVPIWWDEGKLVSKLRTDLLSPRAPYRADWKSNPVSSALNAVKIDGRRFVQTSKGFYEHGPHGKILRSWTGSSSTTFVGTNRYFRIPRINASLRRGRYMVRMGALLGFVEADKGIMAFDPKTETWYGPMGNWNVYYAVGAERGMWLAAKSSSSRPRKRRGAVYVDEGDFVQAAREAGRAYTSRQYAERLQERAGNRPLLDRAKLAIMVRDHGRARTLLNELLEREPNHAEALFLRGLTHDRWGLRQVKRALADYRTLAGHGNPSARLTGMFFELMVHERSKDYGEIAQLCERILREFPNLERKLHRHVDWWLDRAKKRRQ